MYFALRYELTEDYLQRRAAFRDEHLGLARAAHERGELLMAGALADPADEALLIWQSEDPELVESFARQDPYVINGLVVSWTVRPWTVVIGA